MIANWLLIYAIAVGVSFLLYTPKLVQFFYAFKKPQRKKANDLRKISLVIPALDESKVIGDLFDSVDKQTYDENYYTVNVIVKDEQDPTVELAKARGYQLFVVPEQTCKGEALDGYFKQTKSGLAEYDAFVIIDADAVLAPDYLGELNNALEYQVDIYLSRKFIKNYLGDRSCRTVFSNCSALTYPMIDDLGNNYRTWRGLPVNMCGQGLMVRREVIQTLGGWPYRTLTEDYELKLDSVLKGFKSMYYPYAIIYTEEVLRHKESYNRRLRWVTGYSQCDKKYKKQIKQRIHGERASYAEWFDCCFALVPIIMFIVTTIAVMVGGAALATRYALAESELWQSAVRWLIVLPFLVTYGLVFCYCSLAMAAYHDVFKPLSVGEKIGTLLFAPLFMLEYFPIYLQSRIRARKGMKWEPTKHLEYNGETQNTAEEQLAKVGQEEHER